MLKVRDVVGGKFVVERARSIDQVKAILTTEESQVSMETSPWKTTKNGLKRRKETISLGGLDVSRSLTNQKFTCSGREIGLKGFYV